MRDWHHRRTTDLGLRLGGAVLCGLSWLAIRTLVQMRLAPWPASPGPLAFVLAAIGFVGASAGAALLTIGHHIFDQVEISERWRPLRSVEQHSEVPVRTAFEADAAGASFGFADDRLRSPAPGNASAMNGARA